MRCFSDKVYTPWNILVCRGMIILHLPHKGVRQTKWNWVSLWRFLLAYGIPRKIVNRLKLPIYSLTYTCRFTPRGNLTNWFVMKTRVWKNASVILPFCERNTRQSLKYMLFLSFLPFFKDTFCLFLFCLFIFLFVFCLIQVLATLIQMD